MRRKALLEDAALDPEKWSTLALVKHAETKRKPLNTYLNASYAVKSEVRQCRMMLSGDETLRPMLYCSVIQLRNPMLSTLSGWRYDFR